MLTCKHNLLGATRTIAAYKAVKLVRELTMRAAEVQVVMTEAATRFVASFARPITPPVPAARPARILFVPSAADPLLH
jgi:hypothetical protein